MARLMKTDIENHLQLFLNRSKIKLDFSIFVLSIKYYS